MVNMTETFGQSLGSGQVSEEVLKSEPASSFVEYPATTLATKDSLGAKNHSKPTLWHCAYNKPPQRDKEIKQQ
jgi:hypothetical protein